MSRVSLSEKLLLRAIAGESSPRPPFWLMRQAGRYLPEYREIRSQAGSFLDLCYSPDFAVEVTLQPIRRFGMDAAILFSDILVIPHALGQDVRFEEGRGPILEPIRSKAELGAFEASRVVDFLAPVFETVAGVRRDLADDKALIGFAGAPWTVATYMVEGGSSRDFPNAKGWSWSAPEEFQALIDLLVEATALYLIEQVRHGADVLQIFDTWASALSETAFERWCFAPIIEIVRRVKISCPDVPVIVFPRGAGVQYRRFAEEPLVDAIGLDTTVPLSWARDELQSRICVQGNLDPIALLAGGAALDAEATRLLEVFSDGPFIFNLGHGIVPQTPHENVARLSELIRTWTR